MGPQFPPLEPPVVVPLVVASVVGPVPDVVVTPPVVDVPMAPPLVLVLALVLDDELGPLVEDIDPEELPSKTGGTSGVLQPMRPLATSKAREVVARMSLTFNLFDRRVKVGLMVFAGCNS